MESRNAVCVGGNKYCHSRHMDNAAVNDELGVYLTLVLTDGLKILLKIIVYHKDNLVNCGDNALEEVDVPLFKCLTENGVVGVVAGLLNDVEGFLEGETFLEHKYSDKLRDSHGGVGIIELDSVALGEMREILAVLCLVAADNILDRSGYEEILLLKSQSSALVGVVVGIENIVNSVSHNFAFGSADVVLIVKFPKIKALYALSLPETEGVYSLSFKSDDRGIVGNSLNGLICKLYDNCVIVGSYAPSIAVI